MKHIVKLFKGMYSAGLISLIFIPILCISYLYYKNAFETLYVLDVTYWDPKCKDLPDAIPYINQREFTEITLAGNDKEDRIKLDYARLAIRDLITSKDTTQGVHFHFSDSTNYWCLIRVFDICKIEKALIYIPTNSDIWIFNLPPRKNHPKLNKYTLDNDAIIIKTELELEQERNTFRRYVTKLIRQYWPIELLFAILSVLTIKSIPALTLTSFPRRFKRNKSLKG